ncbi:MAG: hypothetical protein WDA21_01195 [Bacilli bacterium]
MPYKYHKDENGLYIADYNTDILCYNFVILNTISGDKLNMYAVAGYYLYLDYLRDLGFEYELLDCFNNVYTVHNNEFPTKFLDTIPSDISSANHVVFEKKIGVS